MQAFRLMPPLAASLGMVAPFWAIIASTLARWSGGRLASCWSIAFIAWLVSTLDVFILLLISHWPGRMLCAWAAPASSAKEARAMVLFSRRFMATPLE